MRVGPWGVFSGGGVVRAAARRGPTLPPPVPSGPTQLAASPECVAWVWAQAGPGAGATRRGWAPQVGPPAPEYTWHQACAPCPLPCTHLYPGGNGPGPTEVVVGGCLLLPALTAPSAGLGFALGTPGCAGRHALGGRQRKEHSSPCADGPRRAPAAPGPSPSAPPSSVERSWQGWRSQFGIAGASTRPQARPVCEPGPWPGVLGRGGAGALTPVRGPCGFPAQPHGLVSVFREPWRLLWLREGDRLCGLTTRPAV